MKSSRTKLFAIVILLLTTLMTSYGCSSKTETPVPRALRDKPLPQLEITSVDYNREEVDKKFRDLAIHKEFARKYQCSEGPKVVKPLVDYLTAKAKAEKADPEELKQCLQVVLPEGTNSIAIPCYAEKAKFEGRKVWIIVQNWGMQKEKLSRLRVWVINPERWEILYAASVK